MREGIIRREEKKRRDKVTTKSWNFYTEKDQ